MFARALVTGCIPLNELVDGAATVPLVTPRWIDFVSARVHNYEHNPTGFIADQVSLQGP